MPLINCASCGKPRSDMAIICPHCGDGVERAHQLAHVPCRTCGAALERARYLVFSGGVYQHRPCPACGEPYPVPVASSGMNTEMKFEAYKMIGCVTLMALLMAIPVLARVVEFFFSR